MRSWKWLSVCAAMLLGGCALVRPIAPLPLKTGPVTTSSSSPAFVVPPPTPAGETAAELSHKMATLEEERSALLLHVQQLQNTLVEKDKVLAATQQEIQAATGEVAHAHAELKKWKAEIDLLREKLRTSEKENATTLQSVIGLLEQMTQQDENGKSQK